MSEYGPTLPISKEIHETKYRMFNETFEDSINRLSSTLADNDKHRHALSEILLSQKFMAAGRVQAAVGSPRQVTPWNCFVSGTIHDSFSDIMDKCKESGETMRMGGGIGYDFSTLRPRGTRIKSQDSQSSGPVSFMNIYDSICGTIASAGHRRGAQMGVLRVDHPDIIEFINSKRNDTNLTRFNISVAITDEFMEAVKEGTQFDLKWRGQKEDSVDAQALWEQIMRSTWDWAEPGVMFIDRINEMNNLWYCEQISTTNPCGEQPLPPYGACLLGSFNLVKYIWEGPRGYRFFDYDSFREDIPVIVRAMDNIIDEGKYPLPEQEEEGKNKRRMGLGITGVANAIEYLGYPYGSDQFMKELEDIMEALRSEAYSASSDLAYEKGSFPLFDKEKYLQGRYISTLPSWVKDKIKDHGIRNSHLISIAPTGTISLSADNISSGIEPVFTYSYSRTIQTFEGPKVEEVDDFGYRVWGVEGRKAEDIPVEDHVNVLTLCQQYVDSACSKTCNVGDEVTWDRFKNVYLQAYKGGAKGCTTFRAAGSRYGVLNKSQEEDEVQDEACFINPQTGQPECS